MSGATFYLGAPEPAWLRRSVVPLFVSHVRLRRLRTLPVASCRWALDSGGFSELAAHGRWTVSPADYVAAVRRYRDEIGSLDWAAPQDWMCEPDMIAKTGLTVEEHQRRTVANYVELRELAPDLPFIPVLQGWTRGQYVACIDMYAAAGVDLASLPRVGVGSVCRRQAGISIALLFDELERQGLRNLHGFGVKTDGLASFGRQVASADSMAWSAAARYRQEPCPEGRRDCRNCQHYATEWRDELVAEWGLTGRGGPIHVGPQTSEVLPDRLFDLVPAGALF